MDDFQIQYEIKPADYAEANSLFCERSLGHWHIWCFLGAAALLVVLPLIDRPRDEEWRYPFLVIPFAGFLTYIALLYVFPRWSARQYYSRTNLAKRTFTAHFSTERVKIEGGHFAWVTEWPGFRVIRESDGMFMFYDGFTMYIFAKRYFAPEQVSTLQRLIQECWKPSRTLKK